MVNQIIIFLSLNLIKRNFSLMLRNKQHHTCFYLESVLLVVGLEWVESRECKAGVLMTKLESRWILAIGDHIK